MMTGLIVQDQNLEKQIEKQMGCMAGIFQIFDRHHALIGPHHKRLYSSNRLTEGSPHHKRLYSSNRLTEGMPQPKPPASSLPLPIFEESNVNKSSWKFSKVAPRLSLDSRATFDPAKGTFKSREIRTVTTNGGDADTPRRSPSVIARLMGLDPIPDSDQRKPELRRSASESCTSKDLLHYRFIDGVNLRQQTKERPEPRSDPKVAVRTEPMARKSFFDSADFFPEPPRRSEPSVYGEIEKRLRMRGIDDPCKDLETLKHILVALQLKGLLHSKRTSSFAVERVHVQPAARPAWNRNPAGRVSENTARSSPSRRRQLPVEQRRASPRSRPSRRRPVAEGDSSAVSDTDTEARRREGGGGGRSILERCDKLLHSIAEMTAELQPSPVSVLDYKEESSPSPIMKRNVIHFRDETTDQLPEVEDDTWSPSFSPTQSKGEEDSDDCDYLYISDVLRASSYLPEDSDIFQLLEKQQHLKAKDTSDISRLQRKLIFDTITEIVKRKRELPPWKVVPRSEQSSLRQIWSEFLNIRDKDASDDLLEAINGVLRKDLSKDAISGWEDCHIELSNAILDIERLIFKELISETIQDLAAFAGTFVTPSTRRRLVF